MKFSNRALDLMRDRLSLDASINDTFKPTSSLNCRFHVSDPNAIKTEYEDSKVYTKPDVIITSTVAAGDQSDNPVQPEYDTKPRTSFNMQQILCCGEFKRRKASLTAPLTSYNNTIRQSTYKTDDRELSVLYPLDESSPIINTVTEERPQKRAKTDVSEPTGSGSATKTTGSKSSTNRRTTKQKSGSRQGTSNNETTHYPVDNSQKMIDARTQCAVYGMEMLSYAIGVHHSITFLIIGSFNWGVFSFFLSFAHLVGL